MSKIELSNIANPSNVSLMNDNFKKIEDALNEEVLYRKGYTGEPNEMQSNLDMNGKEILNVSVGSSQGSLATKDYVDQEVAEVIVYVDQQISEERVYVDQQLSEVGQELNEKVSVSQFDQSGVLTSLASWADVPAFTDPELSAELNSQAQSLVARTEFLNDVTESQSTSIAGLEDSVAIIEDDITTIEGDITAIETSITSKLSKSEDTLTSVIELVTASSASGIIDCATGLIFQRSLTAPTTISFTNISSGKSATLHLTPNSNAVTWPVGIKWVGGVAPTLTAANVLTFWQVGGQLFGVYVGSIV